eukprot:scaffold5551_cov159-Ochromonas_danica.AAC.19
MSLWSRVKSQRSSSSLASSESTARVVEEVVDLTLDDSCSCPPPPLPARPAAVAATQTAATDEVVVIDPLDIPSSSNHHDGSMAIAEPLDPITASDHHDHHEQQQQQQQQSVWQIHADDYHLLDLSDYHQAVHGLPGLVHDCSEEGLRPVTACLPAHKVWHPGDTSSTPPFELPPSAFSLLDGLRSWKRVVLPPGKSLTVAGGYPVLVSQANKSRESEAAADDSVRLMQTINPIKRASFQLPVSNYPHWCEVHSLEELRVKVDQARALQRMLMVVCSKQNQSFWLPKAFHQWAGQYPRLMFAAIDRDEANSTGSAQLRQELLGFDFIDGVCFVSHVPNEASGRAFNACKVQTEDVFTALLTRYHLSCQTGGIPLLETDAVLSTFQVSWRKAFLHCYRQLAIQPLDCVFLFRVEEMSKEGVEDVDALIPSGGFVLSTNETYPPITQPRRLVLPLYPEQLRSIAWMKSREDSVSTCLGKVEHSASIAVPPFHDLRWRFQLQLLYQLRGGVLADRIGFGKTACVLGLISSQSLVCWEEMMRRRPHAGLIPSRATLVVVPPHLVHQWYEEAVKFFGAKAVEEQQKVKVFVLSRVSDLLPMHEMVVADVIIASNSLFDSENYQQHHLNFHLNRVKKSISLLKTSKAEQKSVIGSGNSAGRSKRAKTTPSSSSSVAPAVEVDREYMIKSAYRDAVAAKVNQIAAQVSPATDELLNTLYEPIEKKDGRKRTSSAFAMIAGKSTTRAVWPLECYFWQRLVVDEAHELVASSSDLLASTTSSTAKESLVTQAVQCLSAHYRWGLTGTPPVDSLKTVNSLSNLLHVNVGAVDVSCAQHFVMQCFSSSHRLEQSFPAPVERFVFVPLTSEELAIYKQLKYDLQHALTPQGPLNEALMLQASHFSLRTRSSRQQQQQQQQQLSLQENADNQLEAIRKQKIEKIEALKAKKADLVNRVDYCNSQLRVLSEDSQLQESARRSRTAEIVGRKEELQDNLNATNLELHGLQSSLEYFEQTLQSLRTGQMLSDCPICLEKMVFGSCCMLPCGHVQCIPCAVQLATEMKICATCRQPIEVRGWKVLQEMDLDDPEAATATAELIRRQEGNYELEGERGGAGLVRAVDTADEAYRHMGSKMAYLISQIKAILLTDPSARILVYCQWNTLKMKVREVMEAAQLSFATLEGHSEVIKEVLRRFNGRQTHDSEEEEGGGGGGPKRLNILLCSLEAKAAGLNLQVAQHVMFVHPFFSLSAAQAAAWEAQAIGRVLRPGQQQVVHIWRFVSLQTIDQEIMVKRQMSSWKEHFRSQTRSSES